MASLSPSFLLTNGVVTPPANTPPVSTFLETHPGAYTTTRTHNDASFALFWERHLKRLANSITVLYNSDPQLLFGPHKTTPLSLPPLPPNSFPLQSTVRELVNRSMSHVLPIALKERREGQELSITTLVSGNLGKLGGKVDGEGFGDGFFDVSIYIGTYVPAVFGTSRSGAFLAVVGRGRDVAAAKYSDWVRVRKSLEGLRPPKGTELLLSNDGNRIIEGSVSNFFVVCWKDNGEAEGESMHCYEVQTAPISDGVLPGVIRQLVIEVCLSKGIPFREAAPLWSERAFWAEAFITNSLRLLQHAETISFPSSWESLHSNSWKDISWKEKHFEEGPGMITTIIQKEIMEKAVLEGHSFS